MRIQKSTEIGIEMGFYLDLTKCSVEVMPTDEAIILLYTCFIINCKKLQNITPGVRLKKVQFTQGLLQGGELKCLE